ncbi:TonB-dependent receptor [bacterium]|nr:TonB-dependent receptor [bacterium]
MLSKKTGDDLYFAEYDSPETNNGIAEGMDLNEYYGLNTTIKYGNLSFQGFVSSRSKRIPTAVYYIAFNNPDAKSVDNWSFLDIKYENNIGVNMNLFLRVFADRYYFEGVWPYEEEEEVYNYYETTYGDRVGIELRYQWDISPSDRLVVGVESINNFRADYTAWDDYTIEDDDPPYYDDNYPFNLISFYVQNEYQALENLSVLFGVRNDNYSTYGSTTSPRAAIIYHPLLKTTFKALLGTAFRTPNIYESYYDDEVEVKGNSELNSEKISTYEIVWEQRLKQQMYTTVSLFNNQMKEMIDPVIDPVDSLGQYQNVGEIKSSGIEAELRYRFSRSMHGYISYIYQQTEDTRTGLKLTNSPAQMLKAGNYYYFAPILSAALELEYESERLTVLRTKTEPIFLVNLQLASPMLLDHFRVSLRVKNLLDAEIDFTGWLRTCYTNISGRFAFNKAGRQNFPIQH